MSFFFLSFSLGLGVGRRVMWADANGLVPLIGINSLLIVYELLLG